MNTYSRLYTHEDKALPEEVEVPGFAIDPRDGRVPTAHDLAAILEGGCASGAWMPAVTYWSARQIMADHECAVLSRIEEAGFEPYEVISSSDYWSGWACRLVSCAVELWAFEVAEQVADLLDEEDERQSAEDEEGGPA